jgi:DNA-binding PadR family transcriptional regulator
VIRTVLELIAAHDGAWGWSQLDRHLSTQGAPPGHQLMEAHEDLERHGAIENRDERGHQPRYALTDKGRAILAARDLDS